MSAFRGWGQSGHRVHALGSNMAEPKQPDLIVEQCDSQAQRCRDLAKQVTRPPHRVMLEHIADTWDRIASDIRNRQ